VFGEFSARVRSRDIIIRNEGRAGNDSPDGTSNFFFGIAKETRNEILDDI